MTDIQTQALLRAAFSAGFRVGRASGFDASEAVEGWGGKITTPQTPDEAWNEIEQSIVDISDLEAWEGIDPQ